MDRIDDKGPANVTARARTLTRTPRRALLGAFLGLAAAASFVTTDSVASVATFPATWTTALNGGVPLDDPEGDTPGARDVVGDAANPMLYIGSDATHLYFRLRV